MPIWNVGVSSAFASDDPNHPGFHHRCASSQLKEAAHLWGGSLPVHPVSMASLESELTASSLPSGLVLVFILLLLLTIFLTPLCSDCNRSASVTGSFLFRHERSEIRRCRSSDTPSYRSVFIFSLSQKTQCSSSKVHLPQSSNICNQGRAERSAPCGSGVFISPW